MRQEVKLTLDSPVTRNKEIKEKENILKNIDKCKKMLNLWLQRDITIFGRVLLSKMESISREYD